jgi:hypothetical protein
MRNLARWVAFVLTTFLATPHAHAEPAQSAYSAAGLYNIGNAYARQGKPGMAVLNYERANLLGPTDADIDANLDYVRTVAHLPAPPRSKFDRAVRIASPLIMSWVGVLGLMMIGVNALAAQFSSRFRWLRRAATGVGMSMMCLTLCNGIALWPILHEGVVIAGATPVRVAPVPMGDSLFQLPEAESVKITAEHEGFLLIETAAGRKGWVSRANVASVIPRR